MEEATFRETLQEQGYDAPSVVELDADKFVTDHAHEFSAYALIVEGQFTVTTALGPTTCNAGDTFSLASGTMHSEQAGPQGAKALVGRKFPSAPE
jgi:quercetin dioxygenase-like cupin family protein